MGNWNNRGRGNWNNNGYSNNGYSNNSNRSQKKHSGCRSKNVGDGVTVVSGWNYSRSRGLITCYARPYKGTRESVSQSGKSWFNYFVTIVNKRTMQTSNHSGLFDPVNNRVYIKELNLVMSPNRNYFGTHISKR